MIPVVPHHKVGAGRHRHGTKIVLILQRRNEMGHLFQKDIRLLLPLTISIKDAIFHLDDIPRETHHPFNKILGFILGKLKYNHIAMTWHAKRQEDQIGPRNSDPVDKLVDQNMIANVQRRDHRSGRNFIGLNQKSANQQGKNNGDDQRLCIFTQRGLRRFFFREG